MKTRAWILAFGALLVGCGPPKNAPVFRPNQMAGVAGVDGPFWLAFEAGEQVPLYVDVSGPLFELRPDKPVMIRVKRSFFLLIGDGKPRMSLDRQTLLDGGGSFRFGVGATKERGAFAEVVIRHEGGGAK